MTPRPSSSTCSSALVLVLLALALALLVPVSTQAASCCGSILAQADRLAAGETAMVQLGAGAAYGLGAFFPDASFRTSTRMTEAEGRLRLGGAVRLGEALQGSVLGEWVQGYRRFGTESTLAGGQADLLVGLRLDPPQHEAWAFTAVLALPTGRTMAESRDRFGADATGRGAVQLRLGAQYEHLLGPWFLLAGVGITGAGPERGSGIEATLSGDLLLSAGRSFLSGTAVAASMQLGYEPSLRRFGELLENSVRRRCTFSLGGARALDRWRTVTLAATIDPPLAGFAQNVPARLGVTLGLRWIATN